MHKLKNFVYLLISLTSFFWTGCNSDLPKATVIHIDSTERINIESKELNSAPSEYTVNLSSYDGTTETART